jgi:transposase-like protein
LEDAPQYQTEEAARRYLEAHRWQSGPVCPHCGLPGQVLLNREEEAGTHGRQGLYQCRHCRKQFTVTVGTIFEGSKIPLRKWLLAVYFLCTSSQNLSALQLQRMLKLGSYRTALFLCYRLRWAITQPPMSDALMPELPPAGAIALLLRVKPAAAMPKPGTRRQKSVWSEVNAEVNREIAAPKNTAAEKNPAEEKTRLRRRSPRI